MKRVHRATNSSHALYFTIRYLRTIHFHIVAKLSCYGDFRIELCDPAYHPPFTCLLSPVEPCDRHDPERERENINVLKNLDHYYTSMTMFFYGGNPNLEKISVHQIKSDIKEDNYCSFVEIFYNINSFFGCVMIRSWSQSRGQTDKQRKQSQPILGYT